MDACALIEHMCGLGVSIQLVNGNLRFDHPEWVSQELRRELAKHKEGIISHLVCPCCGWVKWVYNTAGDSVYCARCSEPEDIGISVFDTNAADRYDLRRVWLESEYWLLKLRDEAEAAFAAGNGAGSASEGLPPTPYEAARASEEALAAPEEEQFVKYRESPPPRRCFTCGEMDWWHQPASDSWVCRRCHPPPGESTKFETRNSKQFQMLEKAIPKQTP
jgi:hypothetical protein